MVPQFQNAVSDWLSRPGQELGRFARIVRLQLQLGRYGVRRLRQNNVMAMSAALSFRTIFALIPTLVLAFLAAGAVGALDNSKNGLRRFLDGTGFSELIVHEPDASTTRPGSTVTDEIMRVVDEVKDKLTFQRVGPIGGALFVWTAITLLTTVERSLNRIFGAARSRSAPRRVLLYWGAMTLGPLLLAVTSHLGGQVFDSFSRQAGLSWLIAALGRIGPVVVGVVVLAGIYIFMPNIRVDRRAALGGATIAVVCWLAAKWGFSVYVQRLVVRGNLYGVLGVFPLFLLWLNLSWMIFLFGAELTHTASNFGRVHWADRSDHAFLSASDALAVALAVARPFHAGRGAVSLEQVARELNMPGDTARWLIDRLLAEGILVQTGGDRPRFLLSRPAEQVAVADILRVGEPRDLTYADNGRSAEIDEIVAATRDRMHEALAGRTLGDLVAAPARDEPRPTEPRH